MITIEDIKEIGPYKEYEKKFKKEYIKKIMELCDYNQSEAARISGINRGTIRVFCRLAEIDCKHFRREVYYKKYGRYPVEGTQRYYKINKAARFKRIKENKTNIDVRCIL